MKATTRIVVTAILAAALALPTFAAARGKADFTHLVVIGTSLGAGFQGGSLNAAHQQFSYPAVIARQVGIPLCTSLSSAADTCFAQPLISFPGIGPELQLVDISKPSPVILPAAGLGQPLMATFGRPYNNLSIPSATVFDAVSLTGKEPVTNTVTTFAKIVLRGIGGTTVDQALVQRPTFIIVELGANEVLLGGILGGTPKLLAPTAAFKTAYEGMLDKLIANAPEAGMVVSNLPVNPASLPFINTVPPFIVDPATRLPVLGPDGKPIFYIAETDGKVAQLTSGGRVLLTAVADLAQGYGFPKFGPFAAFPHAGEPLPDKDVLTAEEVTAIATRAGEISNVITQAAQTRNIPVADFSGLFDRVASGKLTIGPFAITNAYITGGFFGLDGFHFTDMGYTLFANEFIKAINAGYGTKIPLASISTLLANNGAFFPSTTSGAMFLEGMSWELSPAAVPQMQMRYVPTAVPTRRRIAE